MPPLMRGRLDRPADTPVLVIRGALSAILGADVVGTDAAWRADLHAVEVPDAGHSPIPDEPVAAKAMKAFLADLTRSEANP